MAKFDIEFTNEELNNEIWKPIVGYPDYYVSSLGRIKYGNKIRKLYKDNHKVSVVINYMGISKCYSVHRIGAKAFIPNPNNYNQIDHIDTNYYNNRINNLRWCTAKQNINNDITIKRVRKHIIELNKKNTIKVAKIDINTDKIICVYNSIIEAAKDTKCDVSKISAIINKKYKYDSKGYKYYPKTCGGYKWKRYYGKL